MSDAAAAKEKLSADLRQVLDDIDALARAAAGHAEGEAEALRVRIRDRLDAARAQAGEMQAAAIERGRQAARATDVYVHEHPWHAIGAAAALGLALGVLIGRR